MSVLVTGANGFVGRRLCARLAAMGAHVTALVRRAEASSGLEVPRISVGDVTDGERMRELFIETRPERVYHLAARIAPATGLDKLARFVHDNTEGTASILAAAVLTRPEKVIVLGSAEEYGKDPPVPIREDIVARPCTPYGLSKLLATSLCQAAWRIERIPVTVLRPFLLYGCGMSPRFFIAQLVEATRAGRCLDATEGLQTRDFLHVDDAVEGIVAASTCAALDGAIVNLCSGTECSLQEVCTLWERLTGRDNMIRFGALPYRRDEIFRLVGDPSILQDATGWSPRISLEEGLRSLWE